MLRLFTNLSDRYRVAACYISAGISYVLAALSPLADWLPLLTLMVVAVTFAFMVLLLQSDAHRVMNEPDEKLDEREVTARNRAFRQAYIALASIMSLVAIYWFIAVDSGRFWLPNNGLQYAASFWLFWLIAYTLPDAVYAFTAPAPVEEA